jgi:hypothetical protein
VNAIIYHVWKELEHRLLIGRGPVLVFYTLRVSAFNRFKPIFVQEIGGYELSHLFVISIRTNLLLFLL